MFQPRRLITALAVALLVTVSLVAAGNRSADAQRQPIEGFDPSVRMTDVAFIENAGQWDEQSLFMARARNANVWLTRNRILFDSFEVDSVDGAADGEQSVEPEVEGFVTALKFVGSNGDSRPEASGKPLDVRYNWIRGEGGRSANGARLFNDIVYSNLFDGIDLRVEPAQGRLGGVLKTTFIVHPGSDPSQILYEYEGAEAVRAIGRVVEGEEWKQTIVIETPQGDFKEVLPAIYQRAKDGTWITVAGGFIVEDGLISIGVADYDTSQVLFIDPIISYSRPFGGGAEDWVYQIREDATGLYAVGTTVSADFPATIGAYQTTAGGLEDAFAAKFDATTGDAQWITYVGGDDFDRFTDFELDGGMIVATGYADVDGTVDFPTTAGVYQPTQVKTDFHPILTRINAMGTGLVYSTFVASTPYTLSTGSTEDDDDYGLGIALAADGSHYIVGTGEADAGWPTGLGIYDTDPDGTDTSGSDNDNGFIVRVSADATTILDFSYIGGDNDDAAFDVELDSAGNPVIVSVTESTDFPTSGSAFQPTRDLSQSASADDIGLVKFNAGLDALLWGTYLGGNDDDQGTITVSYSAFTDDRPIWHGLALDATDRPIVGGTTESTNFPTTAGAFQATDPNGSTDDTFVAILSADGSTLVAGSYLGGTGTDETFGSPVEVDAQGNVYVAGVTEDATTFPVVAAVQPTYGGSSFGDGFTTIFTPDLGGLVCSSYLGGSDSERVLAIVAGPGPRDGRWGGFTNSPDFPDVGGVIGLPTGGFPDRNGFITASNCAGASLSLVADSDSADLLSGRSCFASGDFFTYSFSIINDSDSEQLDLAGPELAVQATDTSVLTACQASDGSCTLAGNGIEWNGTVPAGGTVDFVLTARFKGGLLAGIETCMNATLFFDAEAIGQNTGRGDFQICATTDCTPTVDPNRQLGGQVHIPILGFQGQDDVCDTWLEVQNLGCESSKVAMITWGEPGFCPPQAAGPLKVECTGLLKPGSTWNLVGAQIPQGSKSAILFKFTARQLSELGLDLGFDDITADFLCETLFFGVVGDADDYRRFKKAYDEGLDFAGVPLDDARGDGFLAADVHRTCPGDVTPASRVTSKYNGLAGSHLGSFDEVFGGYGYYVPLIYAGSADFDTIIYIQNGGLSCSSIELWFKAKDDCLRNEICEILTLAPGESYQFDANDCVGPDFQGNAWLRSTQPLGVAVDIIGRDVLMTYVAEPSEINYSFDPNRSITKDGQQVAFGPLIYSEYQGWDSGVQVQNLSATVAAKVKVYFLDRSGDIITTLVDWVCPRGSQTLFLPVIAGLPGNWVGSVRIESQEWYSPGNPLVLSPNIAGVAMLLKYVDAARTDTTEAIAYNLLPEHKIYDWQIGTGGGGLDTGIGLIAIPSLLRDLKHAGMTSEIAITNVVPKPGFTDFAIFLYDQNGLIDYVCQKLNEKQVEYIDLQTWGYLDEGFKGSAIISAIFWEHDVFDESGFFLRNLVGLGAVAIERQGTRQGEDIPGDESAGSRGIPFRQQDLDGNPLEFCFMGFAPTCPGLPDLRPDPFACPEMIEVSCTNCPLPITGNTTTFDAVNVPILNQDCVVVDVDVALDISHTWYGDLFVDLSNEDVASSELFSDICGNFDNMQVTLDDDAAAPIGSVCAAPLTGTFTTESGDGLNDFEGTRASGRWRLDIFDDFPTDDGTLNDWTLRLQTEQR
jgi:hypothetical protein